MKFFKDTDPSAKSLKKTVEYMLTRNLIGKKSTSEAGPYLPLSVWTKQGYNADHIEAKAPMQVHQSSARRTRSRF